jgi:CTP:phosphocholine cytidylyltransferase-like protein
LGEPKLTGEYKFFSIKNIIKHPDYKHASRYNDIALIELATEAEVNQYVIPACLWVTSNFYFNKLGAAGWGTDQIGK